MQYVEERITRIKIEIDLHQASANDETKSSAGDKYETGRAMAQLEIERNSVQLREAEKLKGVLQSIVVERAVHTIVPGSLVTTTRGIFYIAISIGAITLDQQNYFIVSADSPIGKLLLGKQVGQEMVWRNETYGIVSIE
jgi:transcription elongation GreA/GreB family factor